MKKSNLFLTSIIAVVLIFTACQNNKFDSNLLIGSWKVQEWKMEETGKLVKNKMDMTFDTDKNYRIDYGPKDEKGTYWIAGDFLHTVEEGQTEKKVKILTLVKDTLKIHMNRGGHLESVILTKS